MEIKRIVIIKQLEKTLGRHRNLTTEKEFVERLMTCLETLKKDEQEDPDGLVTSSNGECERDGLYAPVDDNGNIDFTESSPFREGDLLPEGQWIEISSDY